MCNLRGVRNPEPNEGKDAQLGGQSVVMTRLYAELRLQQIVEFLDKIGEKREKSLVKVIVEFVLLLFDDSFAFQ